MKSKTETGNLAWLTAYDAEYSRLLAGLTTEEQAGVLAAPEGKRNAEISLAAYRHANKVCTKEANP